MSHQRRLWFPLVSMDNQAQVCPAHPPTPFASFYASMFAAVRTAGLTVGQHACLLSPCHHVVIGLQPLDGTRAGITERVCKIEAVASPRELEHRLNCPCQSLNHRLRPDAPAESGPPLKV